MLLLLGITMFGNTVAVRNPVETLKFMANYLDFCIQPVALMFTDFGYNDLFFHFYGVTDLELEGLSKRLLQENIYEVAEEPRIPFISHRIWFTDSSSPVELTDHYNDTYKGYLETQIRTLDSGKEKYRHFAWTKDQSLIPKSVEWLTSLGIEIREISELKLYDKEMEGIVTSLINQGHVAAASDIIRMMILYEVGGFYMDCDVVVH